MAHRIEVSEKTGGNVNGLKMGHELGDGFKS